MSFQVQYRKGLYQNGPRTKTAQPKTTSTHQFSICHAKWPIDMTLNCPQQQQALDEWCDEWLGTDVINQSLVDDPTALPPGFNLPRHLWANLNHFRTGQGQCAANFARWRKIPDPSCSCGAAKQTMSHIVNDCPLSRFPGGLTTLHLAGDEAIKWLGMKCKL